jgi:hypothetical protein
MTITANGGSGAIPEPTVKVWMGEGSVLQTFLKNEQLVPFFTIVKKDKFDLYCLCILPISSPPGNLAGGLILFEIWGSLFDYCKR